MNERIMVIKQGEEIPQPNKKYAVESLLGEKPITFTVKAIKKLKWNANNDLVVTFTIK